MTKLVKIDIRKQSKKPQKLLLLLSVSHLLLVCKPKLRKAMETIRINEAMRVTYNSEEGKSKILKTGSYLFDIPD